MGMKPGMKMMAAASMRRRRDERGRYMGEEPEMRYNERRNEGGEMRYNGSRSEGGEMRYDSRRNEGGEMRYDSRRNEGGEMNRYNRRNEMRYQPEQRRIGFEQEDRSEDRTEMRRRRDKHGRYMEDDEDEHEMRGNTSYFPPNARMQSGEEKRQKVEAGGTFWMIPPSGEKLTREHAEKWVRGMRGEETHGEMWSFEDAKLLAEEHDIPTDGPDMVAFYAALNMVYNDYAQVAKKHGVDTEDYFADLACAWLYDMDGKPPVEKIMAYKKYVVPHGEE